MSNHTICMVMQHLFGCCIIDTEVRKMVADRIKGLREKGTYTEPACKKPWTYKILRQCMGNGDLRSLYSRDRRACRNF